MIFFSRIGGLALAAATVCVALAFAMAFPVLIVPLFAIWSLIFITLATRSAGCAGSGFCAVGFDVAQCFAVSSGRLVVIFHAEAVWLAGLGAPCPPRETLRPRILERDGLYKKTYVAR